MNDISEINEEGIKIVKEEYPNLTNYIKNLVKQKKRLYNRLVVIDKQLEEWRKIYDRMEGD